MNKLKRVRYDMDPKSKTADTAAGLMGIGMFLRIVYFFALTRLETVDVFMLVFGLVLPLIAQTAFIVMLKALHLNNPWLYAVVGAFHCVVLLILCTQYAGLLRLILGIVMYLACGAGLVVTALGIVNNKLIKWGFFAVAAGRLVFFNIVQNVFGFHPVTLVFEVAAMFELLALGGFLANLYVKKKE